MREGLVAFWGQQALSRTGSITQRAGQSKSQSRGDNNGRKEESESSSQETSQEDFEGQQEVGRDEAHVVDCVIPAASAQIQKFFVEDLS